MNALEADAFYRRAFGDTLVSYLVMMKRFEIGRYQDAPRQHAERAFQHAHVLVEHHGTNAGALEQGHHCRDQNHVVGANEFAQFALFLLPRRQRFYKALFYVVWHPRRQWNFKNLCPL